MMNYFLPLKGIASMHCSANTDKNGENTAIFFGPVSYTHLDVYKRQDKEIDKDKGKGIGTATANQRTRKKPQAAVFSSLPSGTNRIGYAGRCV